ncbi:MAG: glutathionylspermidine synthase [Nitratiruptor sp.]|nr:glutathionylspermidine synthase [Nitratiruptor sp.]NPA83468.1 glutathionylspermidine synthase family protein [Campylobacterota bacterium]
MVELRKVEPLPQDYLEQIGFAWHTDPDGSSYVADEVVLIDEEEAQAYYDGVNELYELYVQAAEHVIEHQLFFEVGIPFNLVDLVKASWEQDHWHLYGRFDLAGGIDGHPIKLLEFNADTPTALFETAIIQWALLRYNGFDEAKQFNRVYEAIRENFRRLITHEAPTDQFFELYQGEGLLLSSIAGSIEDEQTTKLLQEAAREAGWKSHFCHVERVGFSPEGIFCDEIPYPFWFKLIPWESIAIEEPELALLLTEIVLDQRAIILNPAYTLLFQSKGLLPILWELFPGHPLLLEASFEPLQGKPFVEKKVLGREGANVRIFDANGQLIHETPGPYDHFPSIYQEYVELPKDSQGHSYQAGVFFAYEGCGLGFRRGGAVLDNMSKFVGHMIR